MDKAEAKKEISLLRQKRQNAIDDARITYLEGFIDGQKELEQYAQQVSKEKAIDFTEWIDGLDWEDRLDSFSELYDKWINNQQ